MDANSNYDKCLSDFLTIFNDAVNTISSLQTSDCSFEILPAMQIVAHYISHSADNKKCANQFRSDLSNWIYCKYGKGKTYNRHMYRVSLYRYAFHGAMGLRWEWNFSKRNEEWDNNPILRVCALFLDILINPKCINEELSSDETYNHDIDAMIEYYHHAPIMLHEVTDYAMFRNNIGSAIVDNTMRLARTVLNDLS